jgi:hypothetical protein
MNNKMKITGYACIIFAAGIAIAMLFGWAKDTPGMEIMKYWGVTGIGLLTVNAGKRLGGHIVMNQNGDGK